MATPADADYFARRAREERAMSSRSTDPRIAAIHTEMAELYEKAAMVPELRMAS